MKCPRCGAEVAPGEKFCKTCGNLIVNNEVQNTQINNEMPKENPTISNDQFNNMNVNEPVNTKPILFPSNFTKNHLLFI